MTKQDFLKAGFIRSLDPQFKFEYDLSSEHHEYEEDEKPALLYDASNNEFCVTDGSMMFIYFNAATPDEAIKWASMINRFEPN